MAAIRKVMMLLTVTSITLMIMMSLVLITSRSANLTSDLCECQSKCEAMLKMSYYTQGREIFPFPIHRSKTGRLQQERRYGLNVQQSCNNNDECDLNTMECVDKEDGNGRRCYYTVGNHCPTGNTDDCSTNMICVSRQDDKVAKCRYTAGSLGCAVIDIFCEDGAVCEADICDGSFEPPEQDCSGHSYKSMPSGVRSISPTGSQSFQVYCDHTTDGGGWTVFQRRLSGFVDFYRPYKEYQLGFGDTEENFWLGLDFLHTLTSQRKFELRIDLWQWDDTYGYATYSNFRIANSSDNYRLHFDHFTGGTAGDSLSYHNNQQFSTHDADHDSASFKCAQRFHGAWWFKNCHFSNLNGDYKPGSMAPDRDGVSWRTFGGNTNSLRYTEMKVRPMT